MRVGRVVSDFYLYVLTVLVKFTYLVKYIYGDMGDMFATTSHICDKLKYKIDQMSES